MVKRWKRIAVLSVLSLFVAACNVPGHVTFEKVDGEWRATGAVVPQQDLTPRMIQRLEDRLNGR